MNGRQRFYETTHFGNPDRPPYWELGYWGQAIERWQNEGMPKDVHLSELFGLDHREQIPIHNDIIPGYREEVVEETDRYVIMRHSDGVLSRSMKEGTARGTRLSMDQRFEFPLRDREVWERDFKHRLNLNSPRRMPEYWDDIKVCARGREHVLWVNAGSLYGKPRNWMGFERAAMMFYDDPKLWHEILDLTADMMVHLLSQVLEGVPDLDYANFWEDMAYKAGPMISPKLFREFLVPRYKRITEVLHKHGVDIIMVDCDGYVDELIPLWLEAGINCVWPFEVAAGEDIVALRKKYGRDLIIWGGIDKRELAKDRKAIEKEVYSKIPFMLEQGGYIPGVDHSVPHDVSYANYCYYRELLHKVCEKG